MEKGGKNRGRSSQRSRNRKKSSVFGAVGSIFWIALIILIIIVFIFILNYKNLGTILDNIGFPDFLEKKEKKPLVIEEIDPAKQEKERKYEKVSPPAENVPEEKKETVIKIEEDVSAGSLSEKKKEPVPKEKISYNQEKNNYRKSALYLVSISDDGNIMLNKVIRKVLFSNSPLTATINALLEGLSADELNKGLISLIPDNTKLLGVRVDSGVAYIDFSEEFEFNTSGNEGIILALKQIVYTATEFPTVKSVQILIEGKKIGYLTESISVEKPIYRESF